MSYEDLILLYPWVDLVLELFKGVMPTLVALLAIYLNNSFASERELIYRKKNLQLDYPPALGPVSPESSFPR